MGCFPEVFNDPHFFGELYATLLLRGVKICKQTPWQVSRLKTEGRKLSIMKSGLKYPSRGILFAHDMDRHFHRKGAEAERLAPRKDTRVALSACKGHRSIRPGTGGLAQLLKTLRQPASLSSKERSSDLCCGPDRRHWYHIGGDTLCGHTRKSTLLTSL